MTYEQWERVADECHNEKMVAFAGLSNEAQKTMREAVHISGAYSPIEVMTGEGLWRNIQNPGWLSGIAYRIDPSWPGPPKPEPVVEYEDVPVEIFGSGRLGYQGLYLEAAQSDTRFAGYVMPDGRIRPRLLFDQQKDGTYRLRAPKAVRLVKEDPNAKP